MSEIFLGHYRVDQWNPKQQDKHIFKSWDPIFFALITTLFQDVPYNSGDHYHLRRHRYCFRPLGSSCYLPLRLRMCSSRMLQVSISTPYSRLQSPLLEHSADLRSWDYIMSMSAVLCNRAEGLNFQILTNLNIKANGRERWKSWLRRQKVFFKLEPLGDNHMRSYWKRTGSTESEKITQIK